MSRKFTEKELVLATHNQGKVKEIAALLGPHVERFYAAGELDLSEPEETGVTFEENAILKAQAAAQESGKVALADDSGLAVTALNGEPGIYSARWAKVDKDSLDKDFNLAMQTVHEKLGDSTDRSATFVCVLALAWPDGHVETFEGRVGGEIVWPPKGEKGFGYDPIFVPKGHDITFGEMEAQEKHKISHRARAFERFVASCFQDQDPQQNPGTAQKS